MSGFNLSQAKTAADAENEGVWIELADEVGNAYDPPFRMLVAGTYSSYYRKIETAQTERAFKMGKKSLKAEILERHRVERAAACVLKWEGISETAGGPPLEPTRENVTKVLGAQWIREQVEEAMNDHASFSKSA